MCIFFRKSITKEPLSEACLTWSNFGMRVGSFGAIELTFLAKIMCIFSCN